MAAAALLAAWAGAHAQAACPLPPTAGARLDASAVQLAWRSEPRVIPAQQPFAIVVSVCPAEARLLRVDATMPEHGHGMNYRASITPQGAGLWRAEGLLWHMSGRWELGFEVDVGGRTQWLRQSVNLK